MAPLNDDSSCFSTRTCLFTAANDRSHKCFHRYVQKDINSSHLLHKAHSGGQSRKDGGQREHILYTKFKYACFTSYRKKDRGMVTEGRTRGEGKGSGGFRLIVKYKKTCTNLIASRHCAPIFTVVTTGSRTVPQQDHPFQVCRYKGPL